MKPITTLLRITNGQAHYDREGLKQAYQSLNDGYYWLTIQSKHKGRSNQQNAYYWGVIVEAVRICLSDTEGQEVDSDYAHEVLKYHLNPKTITIGEKLLTLGGSTSELTTVQFNEYVERCRTWAMDMFNVYIQEPNEYGEQNTKQV